MNLTKSTIDGLPFPEKGRKMYGDDKDSRLWLYVTPTRKAFYYVNRVKNRTIQKALGHHPEMTTQEARRQSTIYSGRIAAGEDPFGSPKPETLRDMFNRYCELREDNRTIEESKKNFRRYLSHLSNRRYDDITKDDVRELKKRTTRKHGKTTANRTLALLRSIYNTCEIPSPVGRKMMHPENERTRFIEQAEMPALISSIEQETPKMRDLFFILLFVGCRKGEACAMEWKEIDWTRRIWTVPADKFKTKVNAEYSLGNDVIEILRQRYEANQSPRTIRGKQEPPLNSEYVFPSHNKNSKTGHVVEPKRAWKNILERAGLHGVTIHDLRRTHGTWLVKLGKNAIEIARTLNQKTLAASKRYQQIMSESRTEGQNEAVAAMRAARQGTD